VSSEVFDPAGYQVHYLGSSADLMAVRRSLQARGVVSRSRLTPTVALVVADDSVPLDHATLLAARELGIDVLAPARAIDRLLAAPARRPVRTVPMPVANPRLIVAAVLILLGLVAALGFGGAFGGAQPSQVTTVQQVSEED
jgi:hypothetical protein